MRNNTQRISAPTICKFTYGNLIDTKECKKEIQSLITQTTAKIIKCTKQTFVILLDCILQGCTKRGFLKITTQKVNYHLKPGSLHNKNGDRKDF